MPILVTGGTGYIGSHTCVELLENGHDVVVLDNLSNSSLDVLNRIRSLTNKDITFYEGDLLDRDQLEAIFNAHQIDAVIHFAGLKSVGESVQDPNRYYSINLNSTLNLLQVMDQFHVRKMIFSSSATVYSEDNPMPLSESASLQAINPYGRTKLIIEQMLKDHYQANPAWSFVILRYFNPIGAHLSGEMGEDPRGRPNNLMPYITQVAIGKLPELNIFGNDYPTPDGTGVRDYIHVVDLAKGHLQALEKAKETGFFTYNLGTGKGYSVFDVIEAFEKVCGQKIPYRILNRRQGDVPACWANPEKAKKELYWEAKFGLDEMCRDSWLWQMRNPNGYEKTHTFVSDKG
ncbi:UDP-glucose 4-epimerase GalE [Domibacillus iocasae]|uniref:UDP-glucose 4-epimerase n=1 Tax=Domibacillus iocasae TaxID=1714016 RepID=A0A1E7DPF8_9BACI|nr:UDP-glucose 4-epimerase GalE [Domibacillus iocasae]OES44976.1 UDP-glucose 4-epimerase GalE [Domibacillus iocasae]